MSIAVATTPAQAPDVAGATVFVIDILRATTTISAAMHGGAAAVVPAAGIPEARALARALEAERPLLAGERGADPIPDFDIGNSPGDMTPALVQGRVVVMTTSNGTGALRAVAQARAVHPLAATNLSVATSRAQAVLERGGRLVVVCSGMAGRPSREDRYCAGRFLGVLLKRQRGWLDAFDEEARSCLDLATQCGDDWYGALMSSRAGQKLTEHGYGDDVRVAARQDHFPVLPELSDGRLLVTANHE
jgi:2-phosphosulfolactate phosphatase